MRKSLVAALGFAVCLLLAPMASAVPIGTRFQFQLLSFPGPPGPPIGWTLTLYAEAPVAAIAITAPETATFMINPLVSSIAAFGSGSSFSEAATPGLYSLNLNPATCIGINCTPFVTSGSSVLLGTFQQPPGISSILIGPDDNSAGGTVFDAQLVPYNVSCSGGQGGSEIGFLECVVVPEPAPWMFLAAAALALRLIRRH